MYFYPKIKMCVKIKRKISPVISGINVIVLNSLDLFFSIVNVTNESYESYLLSLTNLMHKCKIVIQFFYNIFFLSFLHIVSLHSIFEE